MFSVVVNMKDVEQIREFLRSDECHLIDDMNRAGLSFSAMAFVIQSIENICNEVEAQLIQED